MLLQKRQELVGNSSKAPEESFDATVHWAFLGVGTAWKQRTHIYDFGVLEPKKQHGMYTEGLFGKSYILIFCF